MSVAIGLHLGGYILVAADTRTTNFPAGQAVYRDGVSKVQRTDMGLITGTGWGQLLDAVKDRFAQEAITSADAVRRITRDERARHAALPVAASDPIVRDALQTTGWLFSYVTPGPDVAALRLIVSHPSVDNTLESVEEGRAMVMMPTSATEAEAAQWTLAVEEHLRAWDPANPDHDLQTSLSHHVRLIAEVVEAVANDHDSVSHTFQVGVHSIRGQTGISDLTQRGGAFRLSLQ